MTEPIDIGTPSKTREILNQYGLRAKKKLGQNFLIDLNILRGIVTAAAVDDTDTVIEVGPGIGSLTQQLAKSAKKVIAYELDSDLIPVLKHTLSGYSNIEFIQGDFLKADISEYKNVKFVANLPYYITSPILFKVLESGDTYKSITVMMQKEVANRLTAKPGTKDYGALTLAVEYYVDTTQVLKVPRSSFMPSPNVDSVVVSLLPKINFEVFEYQDLMFELINVGFSMRRKTLFNNLKQHFGDDSGTKERLLATLHSASIGENIRGESLTLLDYQKLAKTLVSNGF